MSRLGPFRRFVLRTFFPEVVEVFNAEHFVIEKAGQACYFNPGDTALRDEIADLHVRIAMACVASGRPREVLMEVFRGAIECVPGTVIARRRPPPVVLDDLPPWDPTDDDGSTLTMHTTESRATARIGRRIDWTRIHEGQPGDPRPYITREEAESGG